MFCIDESILEIKLSSINKTALQLCVQILKKAKNKFLGLLPDESRDLEADTVLSSKKPIHNATRKSIKNMNGYRTIGIKLNDGIRGV